mmetsp:Transcript_88072/g.265018  ORF Transcript_88072/g.265018 Transcript_88072/m.265018 type:complete len:96 (+) Transcript_88072:1031-1318(+)
MLVAVFRVDAALLVALELRFLLAVLELILPHPAPAIVIFVQCLLASCASTLFFVFFFGSFTLPFNNTRHNKSSGEEEVTRPVLSSSSYVSSFSPR